MLAPDVFHAMEQRVELGYDGADLEQAFDFYQRFDPEAFGVPDMIAAVASLASPACTGKVRRGRHLVWAANSPGWPPRTPGSMPRSVITALGSRPRLTNLATINCPVTLHFGETDKFVPEAAPEHHRRCGCRQECRDIHVSRRRSRLQFARSSRRSAAASLDGAFADADHVAQCHRCVVDLSALYVNSITWNSACVMRRLRCAPWCAEPYVSHIPTAASGVGHDHLLRVLPVSFHPENPKRYAPGADQPHHRDRPHCR